MPHLNVESSTNLEERTDFSGLSARLCEVVLSTGLFEMGAVRVGAVRCDYYAFAERKAENALADLTFRIGKGRSHEEKKPAGEAIFAAAQEAFVPLFESLHIAPSLEVREIESDLSCQRNAMHARLRKAAREGVNHVRA